MKIFRNQTLKAVIAPLTLVIWCFVALASVAGDSRAIAQNIIPRAKGKNGEKASASAGGRSSRTMRQEGVARKKDVGPLLVVTIVLDQCRERLFHRLATASEPSEPQARDFQKFMKSAIVFREAHYGHAATYTGPGHTVIASGRYAESHGVTANKWYDVAAKRSEAILYDRDSPVFGNPNLTVEDENSPKNVFGDMLGDRLKAASPKSRIVSIALKDRAAIAMAGHRGAAYWFDETQGIFTTSRYYAEAPPDWVAEYNAGKPADSFYGRDWEETKNERLFAGCQPDDFPYEASPKLIGRTFPHTLKDPILNAPGRDFYEALTHTPFGVELTFDFARRAVEREHLGAEKNLMGTGVCDLLYVSLTPTDYVGHAYGAESREAADITFRTLEQIGAFINWLDARIPPERTAIIVTADHGSASLPEWLETKGVAAFRIKKKTVRDAVESELARRFGSPTGGQWVAAVEDPSLYLDQNSVQAGVTAEISRRAGLTETQARRHIEEAAGRAALSIRGTGFFVTRSRLIELREAGATHDARIAARVGASADELAAARSFHPQRSGDLLLFMASGSIWGKYAEKDAGTTHGSPNEYDRHVPLLIRSPKFSPKIVWEPVDIADVAKTIAALLGVSLPDHAYGKCLQPIRAKTGDTPSQP